MFPDPSERSTVLGTADRFKQRRASFGVSIHDRSFSVGAKGIMVMVAQCPKRSCTFNFCKKNHNCFSCRYYQLLVVSSCGI